MFDLSTFDLDFRPETYWPEGYVPFVPEEDSAPIAVLDPSGEVYSDADENWFWIKHPDEVVIATIKLDVPHHICAYHDNEGRIRYRYISDTPLDLGYPPVYTLGIPGSDRSLTFGELLFSIDWARIEDEELGLEPYIGLMAFWWALDELMLWTRTERLFAIASAAHITSPIYPELELYYQRVGGNYVQTGEIFQIDSMSQQFQ